MLSKTFKVHSLFALVVAALGLALTQSVQADGQFTVDYRLTERTSTHLDGAKEAEEFVTRLKKLGCEAKQSSHGDHYDVTYSCPKWRRIALKNHDDAHKWEKWLKANGFETKHTH